MAEGAYQAEKNKMNSAFGSISKLVSRLEYTLRLQVRLWLLGSKEKVKC